MMYVLMSTTQCVANTSRSRYICNMAKTAAIQITKFLLTAIEKTTEGYLYLDYCYRHPRGIFNGDYEYKQSSIRSAVHRLNTKGFLEKEINENKTILKLTDAGKDWLTKFSDANEQRWDGLWRIVIFDIPESHKKVRDILRFKLKGWGFVKLQKSVWGSKKPLTNQLRKLVSDLGISEWVIVIESSNAGL